MALTTLDSNIREMAWAKQTWMEAQQEMFFAPFIGEEEPTVAKAESTGFNNIITKKTDLQKAAGDRVQVRLLMQLTGDGVTGDSTLEGNEEKLQYYYQNVTVDQLRHAVRLAGKMEEQRFSLSLRTDAKAALKMWWANELDDQLLTALKTSPTAGTAGAAGNRVLYGGDATSTATLEATDIVTPTLLAKVKLQARLASPRIRPIKYKGKEYFVFLYHDYNKEDLKRDDEIREAMNNAWNKNEPNPLFSGADFEWNGLLCWSYNKISTVTTGGSGGDVPYSQCLLLGAQAGILAVANAGGPNKRGEVDWNEETFDYGNQTGFEAGMIFEAAKSQYNSVDYGAISVYAAYTDIFA